MKSCLWIALLVTLAIGTKTQDFDLADALDFDKPKATAIPKQPKKPAKDPSPGGGLDLFDALGPEDPKPGRPAPAPVDPKKPADDGMGFDLSDALGPDPVPGKPAVVPPKDGGTGGGSFGDKDLFDVSDNGDYKPDPGKGGGGGGGGGAPADQPQDLDLLWGQFLKMLDANMPEGVHVWISNIKQAVLPLLEKVMELLDVGQ
ncbi:CD99 molecule isoform X3 [Salmo salar]|uniref:CD99 molecule isoform X3 n=1 Tax=Salmo salar TaxID=8030 RepID=A0A1S3MQH9_SALSA|nr:CD99 molecule isoform X3 [Salmo salar]|eukprot:XP_014005389.1 PREDICTED: CD99 molecule isoform X4 [Salmo salar]